MQALINANQIYTNGTLGYILLLVLLIFFIISIVLFISLRIKSKSEKESILTSQKLSEDYVELEQAYEEVRSVKEQLNTKYEELKQYNDKIKKIAYTDYLTELPNRLSFNEMLDRVMLTLRNEEIIAIMDVDIDDFKRVNDTLGHSYGDELLIDVTHRLKQAIDENDYLARVGGNEFMIITQNIKDFSDYESKIKKIQKIFNYPFVLAMKEYFITVSFGISFAPKDGKTTQVLVKNAYSAMHAAKNSGKNTYCYFNEAINERLMSKIETQSEMRKAIENKEFIIYYQPQVNLKDDKIIGFEALIRWNHPTKGVISPREFIPFAEETGLIVSIGKWVLTEACRQLKTWEDAGYRDLTMAVNISARQFKDPEFVTMVKEVIDDIGIHPYQLDLEITEAIALGDMKYSISTIQELRDIGVIFSIDDFGTGYSSMNYLTHLPVNNIKIDKSFIDNIFNSLYDKKIVESIISLTQTLNLSVVAEGVELTEQEQFLKEVNCDKAQGYLYSEPLSKDTIVQLLEHTYKLN